MDYKIIVDSCCDITPEVAEQLQVQLVPLTLQLGEKEFKDDYELDLPDFMAQMKACTEKAGSAAPSPQAYMDAIIKAGRAFVVTASSKISGSYSSAKLGEEYAIEKGTTDVHVFDSKTASAGEMLIVMKLRELIAKGLPKDQIVNTITSFIDGMKTYFVLECYDNLIKSGRLNKITEKIISMLNIRLIMGSDGDGSIALHGKPRGSKQMLDKLISFVGKSERPTEGENMVISHCNNLSLAEQIAGIVREKFNFKEILIMPTRGISSLYADEKGIIIAF